MGTPLVAARTWSLKPLSALRLWTIVGLAGTISLFIYFQVTSIGFDPLVSGFALLASIIAAGVAVGWRWAPLLGALWSILVLAAFGPYLIYDLTHPAVFDHFSLAVPMVAFMVATVVAGIGAIVSGERQGAARRVPRWLMRFVIGTAAFVLGMPGPVITPAVAARHYHPPLASDCSEDVAKKFNAWLATVPDGATIALKPHGCYLVNETTITAIGEGLIAVVNRHNLTILGQGATIKTTQAMVPGHERALLYFELGGGFVVRDLTLQGVNFTADCPFDDYAPFTCYDPSVEGDANVRLRGVDGALFDNMHFLNAWGDGIEVDPGRFSPELERTMSRNVTIQNSTVDTVGRHAFTCTGCQNFVVRNNTATNIGYHGVDVELETTPATGDLTLVGNTFSNYWGAIVSASGGGAGWGDFVIRQNVVLGRSVTCLTSYYLVPNAGTHNLGAVTIADNSMESSAYFAWIGSRTTEGIGASEVRITGNTATVWQLSCGSDESNHSGLPGGPYPAVILFNTPNGAITSNTFIAADPVAKQGSSDATVCGNRTTADGAFDQPEPCP
jgi:hypothetical protein